MSSTTPDRLSLRGCKEVKVFRMGQVGTCLPFNPSALLQRLDALLTWIAFLGLQDRRNMFLSKAKHYRSMAEEKNLEGVSLEMLKLFLSITWCCLTAGSDLWLSKEASQLLKQKCTNLLHLLSVCGAEQRSSPGGRTGAHLSGHTPLLFFPTPQGCGAPTGWRAAFLLGGPNFPPSWVVWLSWLFIGYIQVHWVWRVLLWQSTVYGLSWCSCMWSLLLLSPGVAHACPFLHLSLYCQVNVWILFTFTSISNN